jgi:hypothetical protein
MKASDILMLAGTGFQILFLVLVVLAEAPVFPTCMLTILGIAYQVYGVLMSYEDS